MASSSRGLSVAVALALIGCVLFFSQSASACSCMMSHPQERACKADFIIRAKVLSNKVTFRQPLRGYNERWTKAYKIVPRKIYKAKEDARLALKLGYLLTPAHEPMCGIGQSLKEGETYLFMGNLNNGMPTITLCDWFRPWSDVTPRQRKGINGLYQLGCKCKVTPCYGDCHWLNTNHKECLWRINAVEDCESDHAVCVVGKSGRCGWAPGRTYSECKERQKPTRPSVVMALHSS